MIETPRLFLRLPELADAEAFLLIHQDPEVLALKHVTLTEPPGGVDVAVRNIDRMLRHWESRGYGQWTVVEKATGEVIGCVGFYRPDGWPGIDLGWILHRSRWGNGFATEATRGAITSSVSLHRIISNRFGSPQRSARPSSGQTRIRSTANPSTCTASDGRRLPLEKK